MSFTSLTFCLFLPIVWTIYWMLHRHLRWQNACIIIASYVFYGWWDWRFLTLIAFTSLASYASGLALEHFSDRPRIRHYITAGIITLNLGILGIFKYFDFFAQSFAQLLSACGLHADAPTLGLILPVGISFYTFQALSYTIDVHRRQLPATRDVIAFFAYICFFPQLVAGPIERATHLLPQMLHARSFNIYSATDGLRQMLWGFCKKMVVADTCAMAVDLIWHSPGEQTAQVLAVGAFLFTMQIYGDFSGYSDIAVGCARLFGIDLMQNFRTPYFARSLTAFWRHWHISLMTWLRDYVYIPLGGNRCSRPRQYLNTLTVFLLSGLWHGAAWTFILWGLYHGVLVCVEKAIRAKCIVQKCIVHSDTIVNGNPESQQSLFTMHSSTKHFTGILTFLLVCLGWIIFRADSLATLDDYLRGLINLSTLTDFHSLTMGKTAILWSLTLLAVEGFSRHRRHALDFPQHGLLRHRLVRWAIYYTLLALLLFCHGQQQTFIYFQF